MRNSQNQYGCTSRGTRRNTSTHLYLQGGHMRTSQNQCGCTSRGTRRNTSTHLYFQGRTHEENFLICWFYQQRNQEEHLYTSVLLEGTQQESQDQLESVWRNTSTDLNNQEEHILVLVRGSQEEHDNRTNRACIVLTGRTLLHVSMFRGTHKKPKRRINRASITVIHQEEHLFSFGTKSL